MIENLFTGLNYAFSFIVILTFIVFIHEMGHYLIAKFNKVKIEAFSIGFGPEIIGFNDKSGTRWKISAIPLGGYVKMFGDMGPTSTEDKELTLTLTPEEKKYAFHCKTLLQKAMIVIAGPAANFILAVIILTVLFTIYGKSYMEPVISEVIADTAAEAANLKAGDRILTVDGNEVTEFNDIRRYISLNLEDEIKLTYSRNNQIYETYLTPKLTASKDALGNDIKSPIIGITGEHGEYKEMNIFSAFYQSIIETYNISAATLKAIGQMVTGKRDLSEISGPIGIAKYSHQAVEKGFTTILWFMIIISINLGLINLFPIPLLDGGHLLYYAIEAIKRKPLSEQYQLAGYKLGMIIVAMLVIFAIFNDINKIF